jgi:hypothetical protein
MTDRNKANLLLLRTMESGNKEIIRSLRPSGDMRLTGIDEKCPNVSASPAFTIGILFVCRHQRPANRGNRFVRCPRIRHMAWMLDFVEEIKGQHTERN